jgi:hypothetical protein
VAVGPADDQVLRRIGAGVPTPSVTKRTKQCVSTTAPLPTRSAPSTRAGIPPGTGSRTSQRVSSHGTTPTTVDGPTAITAVPTAAPPLAHGQVR